MPKENHASFNRSYTYEDLERDGNFTSGQLPFEENDEARFRKEVWEKFEEETAPENFLRYGTPEFTGYYSEEVDEYERYPDPNRASQKVKRNNSGKGPKGWRRSDERILEEVNEALYRSDDVDATEIIVNVRDGVVTLSGIVDSFETKLRAQDSISGISGIRDLNNVLEIRGFV